MSHLPHRIQRSIIMLIGPLALRSWRLRRNEKGVPESAIITCQRRHSDFSSVRLAADDGLNGRTQPQCDPSCPTHHNGATADSNCVNITVQESTGARGIWLEVEGDGLNRASHFHLQK